MTKITKQIRSAVRCIVAGSNSYDSGTIRISADGLVTARKDADKTHAGHDANRYVLGRVDDLLRDGQV